VEQAWADRCGETVAEFGLLNVAVRIADCQGRTAKALAARWTSNCGHSSMARRPRCGARLLASETGETTAARQCKTCGQHAAPAGVAPTGRRRPWHPSTRKSSSARKRSKSGGRFAMSAPCISGSMWSSRCCANGAGDVSAAPCSATCAPMSCAISALPRPRPRAKAASLFGGPRLLTAVTTAIRARGFRRRSPCACARSPRSPRRPGRRTRG